ncbi:tRNA (adenosine(37)-N6)-threonylcarbamoyltransferase complex ATPase subunit type 1 TsaE [Candidatus Pelagibacter bacterium]|jgi:tRNA threonylcarbamoyladenosine biosynthesis protein TsaE|nr:tRNA (adenosine(37)-N6)-threonylcarbamoyltransferase complex ATPase subunit type 1 TsaE [Candidatus Pelagibacter bacterium]MDA7447139.1 tRNA (adenosine(37)-N6)-threonylcarbamoyltransferase complex ATPase subunit type 1 TsaE [Candidatus Pelagibacter ubique]MDA8833707.1 tRNA (adenosine(37)-N6)-threonylcarbamoyltransferase complex ATPase subunit type 1 TsaE [Candidatus Pelagibacter bacterium]MDA8834306.1 tRNA (adenosine(37)-N6)-threonylcarbamoyltransferase complex ATPase subunit type 1 TsaE [Can
MLIATNSEKIDISLEDKTSELAKSFSRTLQKGDVAYFHGEIGVGKTTFIRHLINNLQQLNKINLTEVTSPTFNLVNEYDVGNFIIQHYDLYRLNDYSEIKNIGLFENREEVVTLIEWPEKIKETIDSKIDLHFEYNDDLNKRYLTIKGVKNK